MVSATIGSDQSTGFERSFAPSANETLLHLGGRLASVGARSWENVNDVEQRAASSLDRGSADATAVDAYFGSIDLRNRSQEILQRLAPADQGSERRQFRAVGESLEDRVNRMADQWARETAPLSSLTEIVMHPAYQQIIGMGPAALPAILRRLRATNELWFWALRAISGETPEPPDSQGDVEQMAAAWIEWGHERGLL